MQTILYFMLAGIHAIAFISIARLYLSERISYTLIATLTVLGLFYDNLIIGLGSFIGEGSLLKLLNSGRFYIHALVTPLLIIFAYGVLQQLLDKNKYDKIWHSAFCVLAVVMVVLGSISDIFNLTLIAKFEAGTLRYINDATHGPPIPAIITIVVMIIVGFVIWRYVGWSWLALGSIVMFVAAAVGASSNLIANIGEVVFVLAIVATDYRIHRQVASPLVIESHVTTEQFV
ncbi:MAG: hypothetical protein AAFV93_11110 [Chloroflexota bacterium]